MSNKQSRQEPLEGEVLDSAQPIRAKNQSYSKNRRNKILIGLMGVSILLVPLALLVLFIIGAGAISERALPVLLELVAPIAVASFLILIPFGYFYKPWSRVIGKWLYIGSFVYGVCAWMLAFIVTLEYWGVLGVIIGFILLGIGMVPVGLFAAAFNLDWLSVTTTIALLSMAFASRYYGLKFMSNR